MTFAKAGSLQSALNGKSQQNQPPQKRLEALEQIRQEYHQYKYNAQPRLQRVYTIIKRKPS
jgi:hypothetical protein